MRDKKVTFKICTRIEYLLLEHHRNSKTSIIFPQCLYRSNSNTRIGFGKLAVETVPLSTCSQRIKSSPLCLHCTWASRAPKTSEQSSKELKLATHLRFIAL